MLDFQVLHHYNELLFLLYWRFSHYSFRCLLVLLFCCFITNTTFIG